MRWNRKLPMFVLPFPSQQTWETDSLSIEWTGMFAYAFPPVVLAPKVIQKIAGTKCMVLLIKNIAPL